MQASSLPLVTVYNTDSSFNTCLKICCSAGNSAGGKHSPQLRVHRLSRSFTFFNEPESPGSSVICIADENNDTNNVPG